MEGAVEGRGHGVEERRVRGSEVKGYTKCTREGDQGHAWGSGGGDEGDGGPGVDDMRQRRPFIHPRLQPPRATLLVPRRE